MRGRRARVVRVLPGAGRPWVPPPDPDSVAIPAGTLTEGAWFSVSGVVKWSFSKPPEVP